MIVIGMVTGIASGVALPGHMLLFGEVIDRFVYHNIATDTVRPRLESFIMNSSLNTTVDEVACNSALTNSVIGNLSASGGGDVYLCTGGEGADVFDEVLGYLCDPDDELIFQLSFFAYYYVAIAVGVLLTSFVSNSLLNLSAYRQTRRIRLAFFRNVLRQEIGWFDVTESAQLNTRLSK